MKNKEILKIGDKETNGAILAGISPNSGKPFYVAASDMPRLMTWDEAKTSAKMSVNHNHCRWRLPTNLELDVIYGNKNKGALKGTFNKSVYSTASYWSSTTFGPNGACIQNLATGNMDWAGMNARLSVRLVRD